tara:strand:+ start:859 stop:1623 length:765 start_codon:yes stop_codon:yes gene_type:complete
MKELKAFLKNKTVLYVVAFMAVMNLFGFLLTRNVDAVMFYIILGLLTSYFSKNMIVVLLVAMIGTNLLVAHNKLFNFREGWKNKNNDNEDNDDSKASDDDSEASDDDSEASDDDDELNEDKHKSKGKKAKKNGKCKGDECKSSKKNGFQNMNPKKYVSGKKGDNVKPDSAEQDEIEAGEKPELDFASTLEAAYDNFDNVLDSDAIKSMSEDSQRLLSKQKKLMSNMKNIQPMMKQMGNFLSSFNLDGLTGGDNN